MGDDAPRAAAAAVAALLPPLAAAAAGAHGAAAAATPSPADAQQDPAPSPPEQAGAGTSAPPPPAALVGPQGKKRKLQDAYGTAGTPWLPGCKATKTHCSELGLLLHLELTSMSGSKLAAIVGVAHGTIGNYRKRWAAQLGPRADNAALHAVAGARFRCCCWWRWW